MDKDPKRLPQIIGSILEVFYGQPVVWNIIGRKIIVIDPTTGIEKDCTGRVGEILFSKTEGEITK